MLELLMMQLSRTHSMTARALFAGALGIHLLLVGVYGSARPQQSASTLTDRAVLFKASEQRDCLAARTSNISLTLHQGQRRPADHLAAALSSIVDSLRFAGKAADIPALATLQIPACLAPAASRAPPSLAA